MLSVKSPVSVWKRGKMSSSVNVLSVGDTIDVRGVIRPDGALTPTEIWADIARVFGKVVRVNGSVVTVAETADGVTREVIVRLNGQPSYEGAGSEADMVPDSRIEVIGSGCPTAVYLPRRSRSTNPPAVRAGSRADRS